jgi:hypothetical protein
MRFRYAGCEVDRSSLEHSGACRTSTVSRRGLVVAACARWVTNPTVHFDDAASAAFARCVRQLCSIESSHCGAEQP